MLLPHGEGLHLATLISHTPGNRLTASATTQTQLLAQPQDDGTLLVRLSGDWLLGGSIPSHDQVLRELDRGVAKLAFDAAQRQLKDRRVDLKEALRSVQKRLRKQTLLQF